MKKQSRQFINDMALLENQLNEVGVTIFDEKGNVKPFQDILNDVARVFR